MSREEIREDRVPNPSIDEERRRDRVVALAERLPHEEEVVLDELTAALGDPAWRVRRTAIEALLAAPDAGPVVERLIHALHSDSDAALRNSAIDALIRIGSKAVDALSKHFSTPDTDVRKFIVDVLGGVGVREGIPLLVRALEDPDENVRSAAAENLGLIGGAEALEALVANLSRPEMTLRHATLTALQNLGGRVPYEKIAPCLGNPFLRQAALGVVGLSDSPEVLDPLVQALMDRARGCREMAAESLVHLHDRPPVPEMPDMIEEAVARELSPGSLSKLSEAIASASSPLRRSVVRVLGWSRRPEAIPALLESARDEETESDVAEALVRIGPQAVQPILDKFRQLEGPQKVVACRALGMLRASEAAPYLLLALNDGDSAVRAAAAGAIATAGREGAEVHLLPLLEDEEEEVQEAAIESLAATTVGGGNRVLAMVRSKLASGSPMRRANLVRLLGHVGRGRDRELIRQSLKDDSPFVRRNAVKALERVDPQVGEEPFVLALSDEDPSVRVAAIQALVRRRGTRIERHLFPLLHDSDAWVRQAAVRGLSRFRGADIENRLVEMLSDPNGMVVITAMDALGASGCTTERVSRSVSLLARHPDEEIRHRAEEWMSARGHSDGYSSQGGGREER